MSPDIIPVAAREAQERAAACIHERRFVDSIAHAETAAALCPDWADPWWNLTVGYKHARRWADVLRARDQAIALAPADDACEGPRWNGGIAATALGLWRQARAAWTSLGIDVPAGDGPIDMHLGPTPIRVSPDRAPEVVWCDRIDPCRARIRSVPLPESDRRYDDLVLHDGEARGRRSLGQGSVPVFDELDLLQPSSFGTWEIVVRCSSPGERDTLVRTLEEAELGVEDWTDSVEMLCQACSLGEPHEHPGRSEPGRGWQAERRLGVAARRPSDLAPLRRARLWWRQEVLSARQVL